MNRTLLRLHPDATNLDNHVKWFELHSLTGSEGVSELFRYQLVLRKKKFDGPTIGLPAGIEPPPPSAENDFWLGEEVGAEVLLGTTSESRRYFHGVATEYRIDGSGATVLQVEPKLALFRQRVRTQYFVDRFAGDVIREILDECEVEYRFTEKLDRKPLIVQFRESDTSFVQRLIADAGLCFVFEQQCDSHVMFIGESPRLHLPCAVSDPKPEFRIDGRQDTSTSAILRWQPYRAFRAGRFERVAVKAHAPDTVKRTVSKSKSASVREKQIVQVSSNVTQYPDDQFKPSKSTDWGRTKIDAGGTYLVRPGELIQGPGVGDNNAFTVIRVQHAAQAGLVGNPAAYFNSFVTIPKSVGYSPLPPTQPRVDGPSYATVVAADGTADNTRTAELTAGRAWLRFDDDTSPTPKVPVRLATGLNQVFSAPRIGQRVIVDYEDGLPDRPAIVAIAPHGSKKQLPHDPDNQSHALTLQLPPSKPTGNTSDDTVLQINDGRITMQSPGGLFALIRKCISLSALGRFFAKAKSVFVSADNEIVFHAKKISIVAGGCKIVLDGDTDNIAIDCPGQIFIGGGGPIPSSVQVAADDGKPLR